MSTGCLIQSLIERNCEGRSILRFSSHDPCERPTQLSLFHLINDHPHLDPVDDNNE
jgi:hypothetical protein